MTDKSYLSRPKESADFMSRFSEAISEEQKRLSDAYINSDNTRRLRHGSGWNIDPAEGDNSSEFERLETCHGIKLVDVAENNILKIIEAIELTASSLHQQLIKGLYKTVSEAAESVGNTVSGKDHLSLAETMYAALEKIEFSVDKDGNVCLPTFHVSPEVGEKLQDLQNHIDPDTETKFQSLIQRKSDLALSKEADRKASFLNYGNDQ